jgi:hypothetical protein
MSSISLQLALIIYICIIQESDRDTEKIREKFSNTIYIPHVAKVKIKILSYFSEGKAKHCLYSFYSEELVLV